MLSKQINHTHNTSNVNVVYTIFHILFVYYNEFMYFCRKFRNGYTTFAFKHSLNHNEY